MAKQKVTRLVNVADLLPEPVQGDPEVKVTRQRGFQPDARAVADPFGDLPVVQVDPEVTVTRQKGILHVDEGGGFVRVDAPADWDPRAASKRVVSDQPVAVDAPEEMKTQTLDSPHLQFHKPIQGGAEKVQRVGITTAAQAAEFLQPKTAGGIMRADQPAKGVQIMKHPTQGGQLPDDQLKAYAEGKVFAADKPDPKAPHGKPISFLDQQMKPEHAKAAAKSQKVAKPVKAKKGAAKRAGRVPRVPREKKPVAVKTVEKPPVGETPEEATERADKEA